MLQVGKFDILYFALRSIQSEGSHHHKVFVSRIKLLTNVIVFHGLLNNKIFCILHLWEEDNCILVYIIRDESPIVKIKGQIQSSKVWISDGRYNQ